MKLDGVRVLGACGLLAASLVLVGGALNQPMVIAASGAVMVFANLYAMVRGAQ